MLNKRNLIFSLFLLFTTNIVLTEGIRTPIYNSIIERCQEQDNEPPRILKCSPVIMIPVVEIVIGGGVKWITGKALLSTVFGVFLGYLFRKNGADTDNFYFDINGPNCPNGNFDPDDKDKNKSRFEIDEQGARDSASNKHNHLFNKVEHGPMRQLGVDNVMDIARKTVVDNFKNGFRPGANGKYELSAFTEFGELIIRGIVVHNTIYYGTIFLKGYM